MHSLTPHIFATGLAICLSLFATSHACGQIERLELGNRLQRFEQAWERATPDQKRASAKPMQAAVTSFFSLQLKPAASHLDEAWLLVRNQPTTDWQRTLVPFAIIPQKRVVDPIDAFVIVALEPFYLGKAKPQKDYTVILTLFDQAEQPQRSFNATLTLAEAGVSFPLEGLPAGDYTLKATIKNGPDSFELIGTGLSLITDCDERMDALDSKTATRRDDLDPAIRATVRQHLEVQQALRRGEAWEIDYPAASRLTFCESLLDQPEDAIQLIRAAAANDLWLTLKQGRKQQPIRLRIPVATAGNTTPVAKPQATDPAVAQPAAAPVNEPSASSAELDQKPGTISDKLYPVLILLHGAGGSENMFFETYGSGRTVKLGLERGWLVVAPKQGLVGGVGGLGLNCAEIVNELEKIFPIDRQRIYLIGHSMGAGQVIQQTQLQPGLVLAAAAIGGGRAASNADSIKQLPWFVAAGDLDFGLPGARGFHESLLRAGATATEFKVYPDTEHMVIVQACLDDLFAFFDQLSPKSDPENHPTDRSESSPQPDDPPAQIDREH